jgi:hypothetical protein
MTQILGFATGFISVISYIPYIRDMFAGTTKPERASWFIWLILGGIAFFSQLAKGATHSLWLPGIQSFFNLVIFLLAIKFGVGGFTRRDSIALAAAALGLLLWYFTKEAAVALFIVIAVDAVGMVLTVIKSYEDPGSETIASWYLFAASGLVAAFAVGEFNLILLAYPLYIVFANLAVVAAIYWGRHKAHNGKRK